MTPKKNDFLKQGRCEGCGAYPGERHTDNCPWLKTSLKIWHEKRAIQDMIEKYIDINGIVDEIYKWKKGGI
jgi:hypothetical protein